MERIWTTVFFRDGRIRTPIIKQSKPFCEALRQTGIQVDEAPDSQATPNPKDLWGGFAKAVPDRVRLHEKRLLPFIINPFCFLEIADRERLTHRRWFKDWVTPINLRGVGVQVRPKGLWGLFGFGDLIVVKDGSSYIFNNICEATDVKAAIEYCQKSTEDQYQQDVGRGCPRLAPVAFAVLVASILFWLLMSVVLDFLTTTSWGLVPVLLVFSVALALFSYFVWKRVQYWRYFCKG